MARPEKRAFIYTRLSQDRHGTSESTKRQEADCRALCRREGLEVVRVFSDEDTSAYRGKRPEFTEMLKRIDEVDALVYWKGDRLARRITDFGKVIDACEEHGVRLVSVIDPIDTSSPIGKGVALLLSAQAEQESFNSSTRIKRMHEDLAAKGKPHGGSRPFGYQAETIALPNGATRTRVLPRLDRREATAIRDGARRLLAGGSLRAIAKAWNADGLRTPQSGGEWTAATVSTVMKNPRIAGLRAHCGEIVGEAEWPGIIDRGTYEQLNTMFTARRITNPRSSWAFAGLFRCGKCGGALTQETRRDRDDEIRCHSGPGRPNCGKLSIKKDETETLILEATFSAVDTEALARATSSEPEPQLADASARLRELDARLVELAEMFATGEIDRAGHLAARRRLENDRDEVRKVIDRDRKNTVIADYGTGTLRDAWPKMQPDEQRAVLRSVIDHVTIAAKLHDRREYDPDRVSITWRV